MYRQSYAYRMQPTGLKVTYRAGVIGYLAGINDAILNEMTNKQLLRPANTTLI